MKYELQKLPDEAAELLMQEGALEVMTWREMPMVESSRQVWGRMLNRALEEAKANQPKKGERVIIQMTDGVRVQDVVHDWTQTALAARGKEVRDLTEKEKFCIAFAAQVRIETFKPERKPGELEQAGLIHWRTKHPCGIVATPEGFRVYVKGEA